MYLTRFRVNTARTDARRLLSTPQAMHAAVLASFPLALPTNTSPGDSQAPRVLWRMDRNATAEALLYVVSPDRPDLTHLVEQAGWPAAAATGTPGWHTYAYAPFLEQLDKGTTWNFRLTANPVHYARTRDGQPTTKRTAHLTAPHQLQWLLTRQDTAGFRILTKAEDQRHTQHGDEHQLVIRDQRALDFRKHGTPGRVTLTTVTFDGRLEVTDPDALRRTLTRGLGKAKAYGCGLMTLAPASRQ
ncbi:type I-E CRISPR-associated protein Cas6/Cse3/CasE [Kitasatospora sp. RB6PN24]|uniref:type I-E CRISPR-associated protein Cas6/Cse3/CasE n=1 Tax=Kitasatospora humi TaxID=2893891 RepID=UPI001E41C12D|nr:type I-E CRISPR-associated protein Cas6/Cse3/CasE [Kitasatospora humi]MCC9312505.1 type I-E CRISPR-associated protein Cas6/Cse3/CasE [Kitasatospora humi]